MSEMVNDILNQVDLDALATQLGTDPESARQAVEAAVPTLAQGLSTEAQSEDGARSLATALERDHGADLIESADPLAAVDPQAGMGILGHLFGDQTGEVEKQLGGLTGKGGGLFSKLLPLLAPLVMSWLTKKMGSPKAGDSDGSVLGDLGGLGDLLGGEASSGRSGMPDLGGLFDMLGGGGLGDLAGKGGSPQGDVDTGGVPDVDDIFGGDKK
ncbi:MAG: DUF937 domain-containing protein [Acidimicrobiia bacterium]|nr:DUF937 domain-containing protein [Acidimicrobiia bacterium]